MDRNKNPRLIAELNDQLRRYGKGGRIMITAGIKALPVGLVAEIIEEVRGFDAFDDDNDPWQEHDCARLIVRNEAVLFKVDYYDVNENGHSPDPSDVDVTRRVMTIMLASDY